MSWYEWLFGPPCKKACDPNEVLIGDGTLRDHAEQKWATTDYIKALRKEDEDNGIFIDLDCYMLVGDPERKSRSIFAEYWMQVAIPSILLGGEIFHRAVALRPYHSGIHRYPICIGLGWYLGHLSRRYIDHYTSERDAQLFHYCRLHPEDFQRPKRVLFRDYLREWTPIR